MKAWYGFCSIKWIIFVDTARLILDGSIYLKGHALQLKSVVNIWTEYYTAVPIFSIIRSDVMSWNRKSMTKI